MKRSALLAILLLVGGCRTIVYTSSDGRKLEYYSFGNDTKIDSLEITTPQGSVKVGGLDSQSKALDIAGKALDAVGAAAKAVP